MYRNRGLLFPLVLIAIGIIVLLSNTGVLSAQALARLGDLWPLLLVILGLQLILNHTLPRQQATLLGLGATHHRGRGGGVCGARAGGLPRDPAIRFVGAARWPERSEPRRQLRGRNHRRSGRESH